MGQFKLLTQKSSQHNAPYDNKVGAIIFWGVITYI